MTQWWRFYTDSIFDAKLLRLSDAMFRAWTTLLCIAAKNDGVLPPAQDIALTLRMKPAKVAEWITTLHRGGLLDKIETGFVPHNWNARQYKSDVSTERVKRFRETKRNVSPAVSETAPETDSETDTEKKITRRASAPSDDWPSDFGDQFWQAYPKRTEKIAAMKKLDVVRKSGAVTWADLISAVQRYAASVRSTDPQYIKHPAVWLNKGCWADEISTTGATNGNRSGANSKPSGHDAILAVAARRAREIVGDDEVAGTADTPGFAFGRDADGAGPQRDHSPAEVAGRHRDRLESDESRIVEGEIVTGDEASAWASFDRR